MITRDHLSFKTTWLDAEFFLIPYESFFIWPLIKGLHCTVIVVVVVTIPVVVVIIMLILVI